MVPRPKSANWQVLLAAVRSLDGRLLTTGPSLQAYRAPLPKERYIRVTGAKANYAGRIGDRWIELAPVELADGNETPRLRRIVFEQVGEGFDVRTWEHGETLLHMVREGRGGRRLWSSKHTGPRAPRLDAILMERSPRRPSRAI